MINDNSLYYFFASIGTFALLIGFIVLAIIVLFIVAEWKLFKKAGKNGWESIIPFYSSWVLVEISGLNWWWFLLLIIDLVFKFEFDGFGISFNIASFIASFNCYYNIARRFGKDKTTSIFAGLFPFIFILIFGFSKNEVYDASIPVSVNGIFGGDTSVNDNKYDMNTDNNLENRNKQNYDESTTSVDEDDKKNIIKEEDKIKENDDKIDDGKKNDLKEYSYCSNCGTRLNKKMKFCPKCGKEKNN